MLCSHAVVVVCLHLFSTSCSLSLIPTTFLDRAASHNNRGRSIEFRNWAERNNRADGKEAEDGWDRLDGQVSVNKQDQLAKIEWFDKAYVVNDRKMLMGRIDTKNEKEGGPDLWTNAKWHNVSMVEPPLYSLPSRF